MAVLIKFSSDWADEFDVECFAAYTNTTVEEQTARIQRRLDNGGGFCFGTNEEFEDDQLTIRDYTFTEITEEEYQFLKRNFSKYGDSVEFGTGTGAFESDDYEEDDDDDLYDCEDGK
jgi:hypothetical protein